MNLESLFPRASKAFLEANSSASDPVLEQPLGEEPLAFDQGKTENSIRCILSYTSYRCRLLDEDNWCTKYFTDALRYCGALPDDTPDKVTIQVKQEKVAHRSEERTVIELEYP